MRSNGKDMGLISRDWNSDFEAPILLKERNDSLFRKAVCKLLTIKNNISVILSLIMLYYCKGNSWKYIEDKNRMNLENGNDKIMSMFVPW